MSTKWRFFLLKRLNIKFDIFTASINRRPRASSRVQRSHLRASASIARAVKRYTANKGAAAFYRDIKKLRWCHRSTFNVRRHEETMNPRWFIGSNYAEGSPLFSAFRGNELNKRVEQREIATYFLSFLFIQQLTPSSVEGFVRFTESSSTNG